MLRANNNIIMRYAMRVGLYPGTFDPVTNGHLDITRRSCTLVDRLVFDGFASGVTMLDINNDGWLDIVPVDMVAEDNYRIKTNMSGMNPKRFKNAIDSGFHYQYMMNTLQT